MSFIIRRFHPRDAVMVMEIETTCFTSPWNKNVFLVLASLRGYVEISEGVVIHARIAETDKKIAGYVIWEEDHRKQRGHLLNIAVGMKYRGRKFGKYLALHTLDAMKASRMRTCRLEVGEFNIVAIHLYEGLGFHQISREPDYYPGEDALIYELGF